MLKTIKELFTGSSQLHPIVGAAEERPIEKFESLMLENMRLEPDKWFIDYTAGSGTVRAVNREKGVAVALAGIGEDRRGILHAETVFGMYAYCGRVELTFEFTQVFRTWAIGEYNIRHRQQLVREHDRLADAISEAFR